MESTPTLAQTLEETAKRFPAGIGITDERGQLSWSEIRQESISLARVLAELGVSRGDRVAVWLPNESSWLAAWCAASYLGAAVVPVNTRFKSAEARYVLGQSGAKVVIMRSHFIGIDLGEIAIEATRDATGEKLEEVSELEHVLLSDEERPEVGDYLPDLVETVDFPVAEVLRVATEVGQDDDSIIVYTSGTTGRPKGAVHTSTTALGQVRKVNEWLEVDERSRLLVQLPFFHIGGAFCGIVSAVQTGARMVSMERWDVDRALDLIEAERVTHLMGMPTHYLDLIAAQRIRPRDIESLDLGWIGGASIPADLIDGAASQLGLRALTCVYGMTEAPAVTFSAVDDPPEIVLAGKVRPIASTYRVEVCDPESNRVLPAGVEGEIRVKGEPVMRGYFRMAEASDASLDDQGRFKTGDLGSFDGNGYLSITGRIKDMYIVGGMNTYPAEIEQFLAGLDGVRQANVVGVGDDRLGEVGFAFIEPEPDSGLDMDWLRARCTDSLAGFKVPRYFHLMEEWPVTPTGKIQKFRLAEIAERLADEKEKAGDSGSA